ncbi:MULTISPECIES: HAD family hydrolase [Pantoea]|jgi:HAD superfamily hydrolase (TIGR01509 family)|uniref:Haloacid dehalogenase superfamily, subfamily IA, variant 3 with third motif having DD or ED n=1 Tax=Candidatus Pantoea varia TaxID=1881036 RepID=A0A1I4X567_9GAMM|nr:MULTISPECIES: HAD family phosphatase [Pantoea]MDY0997608.1 HAD family phosphatase [Pantoea agglomerans]WHU87598.1 HAD family phosphatase [Pantoea agglomerans pv. gypsophilae]SFN20520.1 haloacid dehalogenase superfamily, subfamily IA, variant 3 with third motif having DD or ED [Pantoea varia]
MIKAVIFDMDGVLIEAKEWHYEALNKALNLFGYNINRYDHLTKFDGLPTKDKLNILSAEYSLPRELHAFINEMKQHYTMEIVHTKCKPLFIHEYALSRLKSEGLLLAVASNSIKNTVTTMMEKASLSQYLEVMLSNEDVKKGKPDPEIYTKAIGLLGLKPEECVVVEDNENGIKSATAAGANVLVVHDVSDVTYRNIKAYIDSVSGELK